MDTIESQISKKRAFMSFVIKAGTVVVLAAILYMWATLHYVYSRGERSGFLQKVSQKGWLCKTWEGELTMVNIPGATPETFKFSVRDEKVVQDLKDNIGKRISLSYNQHKGIPTTCFGETDYFASGMKVIDQIGVYTPDSKQ